MLTAIIHNVAVFCCGAFVVLLVEAWISLRATSSAITGKGLSVFVQAAALTVAALFAAAMILCTWADYAVSGSINKVSKVKRYRPILGWRPKTSSYTHAPSGGSAVRKATGKR